MATITTSLNDETLTNLVEDITDATVSSSSDSAITLDLVYSEDPQADQLILGGSGLVITGDTLSAGTIDSLQFKSGGASLALISGLSLDAATFNTLLADGHVFEQYIESLLGIDGDDSIDGSDDDDSLFGGAGDDDLSGGDGDDDLYGGSGDDSIDGGAGTEDTVHYEDSRNVSVDLATGQARGAGNDTLANVENVVGSDGNDAIKGNDDDNDLYGEDGNDRLAGGAGNDQLEGGAGNDQLSGEDGDDTIVGGTGNDRIVAGEGNNLVYGDDTVAQAAAPGHGNSSGQSNAGGGRLNGNDNITSGSGDDEVHAGAGNDKVASGNGADTVFGDDGNDTLMTGGGDDVIDGGAGKDNIKAGDGNDVIDGGAGADNMAGGAGDDTYYVDDAKDIVTEMEGEGNDTIVATFSYSLEKARGIENITLSEDASPLNINATGDARNNELTGNSGDNVLNGKAGADILTGNAGSDAFVFDNLAAGGIDTVTDFTSGDDRLALDHGVFGSVAGGVTADNVVVGAAALDANDFLVFDAGTGALYYDADGNGAGTAVQIATLDGVATLGSSDFSVI